MMVFSWDKHVKECCPEADTGERMVCYSEPRDDTRRKDSLLTTRAYWSALRCLVELHLLSPEREIAPRSFCWCAVASRRRPVGRSVMSAETDSRRVLLRQTLVLKQDART